MYEDGSFVSLGSRCARINAKTTTTCRATILCGLALSLHTVTIYATHIWSIYSGTNGNIVKALPDSPKLLLWLCAFGPSSPEEPGSRRYPHLPHGSGIVSVGIGWPLYCRIAVHASPHMLTSSHAFVESLSTRSKVEEVFMPHGNRST